MGCKKITYQNFSFLEVVHRKNATDFKKNRLNGDHLGNVRLSYSDLDLNGAIDPWTEIIEEKNYYPFGMRHKGYNNMVNGTHHPYMFGGKEYQEELDLDWYDISARNYDPALGRWMNIDPLAQKMPAHSPYNYAFNNPINFIDEDGEAPIPAWVIRTVVVNVIKITTKVTMGRKIAKADRQLQNVKSEISSKKTEINNIRFGDRTSSTGGFGGGSGFGSGGFGGAGATGSFGSPMTAEEKAEEKQRQDEAFKGRDSEGYEKVKTLEGEISELEGKAEGLEKKIDGLLKTEKLVRATDPDKIAKEVSEEIGSDILQLYNVVKEKINDDVENRRKEEEKQ